MTYATVDDMTTLWRPMTEAEQARAGPLLEVISASLDVEARKVGKDLPALVASDSALALVAKSVAVDVTARALMTSTDQELGKSVGSDRANEKNTFVTVLGLERRRALVEELTGQAEQALSGFGDPGFLLCLARALAGRRS